MDFGDAKAHLEGEKADTMDLLEKFLMKVFSNKCKNQYVECETILRSLRYPKVPHGDLPEDILEKRTEWAENKLKILKQPTEEDGTTVKPLCSVPNFLEEAQLFETAGYGFGQQNFAIVCALRQLAGNAEGLKKIRLWGKILGSKGDYWVAEGLMDGAGEATEDPLFEPQGTGANFYSYWVASHLDGNWEKLPDVDPAQITVSRQIEYIVSGNLDTTIASIPFFPGTERHYLRAVIARITADTVLTMTGFLEKNEDGGGIKEAEEFVFPSSPSELLNAAKWSHCVDYILINGRTSYPEVADPEAEDAEAKLKEFKLLNALDPPKDILRPIEAAKWALKLCRATGVAHAHSLKWPGAISTIKGTAFANLYVGYGRQMTAKEYTPKPPFSVQNEEPEGEEQPEPQPVGGLPAPEEEGEAAPEE